MKKDRNNFKNPTLAAPLHTQIMDLLPGLIAVYNINTGKYIYINDSIKKILGYTKEEWLKKGAKFVANLVHPDDVARLMSENQKALTKANSNGYKQINNDPIVVFEYRLKHKNGKWIWLKTDGVVFNRNEKGKVEHVMNISVDITERKEKELNESTKREKAENQLRESEAGFRRLFESNIIGIFTSDINGLFLNANDAFLSLVGFSRKDLEEGKIHRDKLTPTELNIVSEKAVKDLKKKGYTYPYEKEYIRKDGRRIHVLVAVTRIDNTDNVIGFILNNEALKQTELALAKLAAIVESSGDAIISKTLDGIITSWNKGAEMLFGFRDKEAIGKHITLIIPPELHFEEGKIIAKIKKGMRIHHYETIRLRKDGRRIPISLSISPIKDYEGKIVGAAKIARDITKQKELERQKDDFMAIASHELKTPVTSIKLHTQILHHKFMKEKDLKSAVAVAKMDRQINKLVSLINDLLDATKIEEGKLLFNFGTCNLNELSREVIEEMQMTTKHKIELIPGKIQPVAADHERIGQVLINFLSNGIKYSPGADKIIVKTSQVGKYVSVAVQDFGMGLTSKEQKKVFERFNRAGQEGPGGLPGLGLGLYISREIVKRHKGKIWVESIKGKGSTFYFSLPTASN